jgi:hypothetical protein
VTQTALARITREKLGNAVRGPMGALGISRETDVDLGKERRTTTSAPPAEILMAVANSRQSWPFPLLVRTKTGMASCNRAHFLVFFIIVRRATQFAA